MKVIFAKLSSSLYTLLLLSFFGLSFLNTQLNFTRTSSEIRDAAPKIASTNLLEKIDLSKDQVKIAETNASTAPRISISSSYASRSSYNSYFSIINPTPTSDNSYISPYESGVKVYKDHFFFAHSTAAFNWIKSASEGNSFTITRNGETTSYTIAKKQVLKLNENYNGKYPVTSYYNSISERTQFLGKTYDVALMTCGDGSFGADGNNSDFRTFIFAYAN